jgi:protoheme IX farnesyltransferase
VIRKYYELAKPGIIYGNIFVAAGGFFFAANGHIHLGILAATLLGLALVIGSGCVFNNYLDRDIDRLMNRTARRASVTGTISPNAMLAYGTGLGLFGALILAVGTNLLATSLALFGLVAYVVAYGYTKRVSVHGTLVGSLAGAMPPVVGYCAVSDHLDIPAAILFLILVCWQMPHFYSIAMYRLDDYRSAKLPVLPAVRGLAATKRQIIAYVIGFTLISASLAVFRYAGYDYLIFILSVGITWIWLGIQGFSASDNTLWARKMFRFSLIVLSVQFVALAANGI